ncbi:MAG TPA: FAD-dependent oxidoreductase [Ktedonobacteraceae bacterium]|nr:FAD-dependent oxidoreductase [Ktedonobacteraceae bacterium]
MQQEYYDVLIVGAGVVGCSIAYHLSKLGLRVALVERGEVAGESSPSEHVGFNKTVNAAGMATLLNAVAEIAPKLLEEGIERSWTGLRPASADGLPLLGASRSRPGLWLASGHFRTGALQGPLTGHILAELIQGRAAPFGLDLSMFDPDRFGGWVG